MPTKQLDKKIRRDQKLCCVCGKVKQLTSFYKDSQRKDGVQSRCKECNHRKRFSFECPACGTKHEHNIDKPYPCPKCWRISIAKSKNF